MLSTNRQNAGNMPVAPLSVSLPECLGTLSTAIREGRNELWVGSEQNNLI